MGRRVHVQFKRSASRFYQPLPPPSSFLPSARGSDAWPSLLAVTARAEGVRQITRLQQIVQMWLRRAWGGLERPPHHSHHDKPHDKDATADSTKQLPPFQGADGPQGRENWGSGRPTHRSGAICMKNHKGRAWQWAGGTSPSQKVSWNP